MELPLTGEIQNSLIYTTVSLAFNKEKRLIFLHYFFKEVKTSTNKENRRI